MNRSTDDLDDLTLPQRPRRPDPRAELRSDPRTSAREDLRDDMATEEREFTLSTGTVLALFFGLALVCAVFFGFGYSMGKKSAAASAIPVADAGVGADATDSAAAGATPSANKPSAGSPVIQEIPGYQGQKGVDTSSRTASSSQKVAPATTATSVTVPMDESAAPAKAKKPAVADVDGQVVGDTPHATLTRSMLAPTPASTVPSTAAAVPVAGTGTVYVQISAVSHKEDADTLMAALRRRGYSVFTRTSDADKLIHVQVGPYANKKDAEVMRQKLLGDGYNAILK